MKEDPQSEKTCSSFQESIVYQNNNKKSILQKINKYVIRANNDYHILILCSLPCMVSGGSHKKLLEKNSYYFHFKMGSLILREFH